MLRVLFLGSPPSAFALLGALMLGVFAEFETNLRRERQREGIAKAKAEGRYTGRRPTIDPVEVMKLKAQGIGATDIAKRLGCGRASVYRVTRSIVD
jgi:DNA invertase Pin-like site-specific DNA recombinase